ncbi:MAG: PTS sugar transporter subunit IIB [Tepidanaerobacteraceae bacterium]|nr:PTS sugar transporter subunit IIB [Tepidanaerobacteraceae bacterium]
MENLKLCRIDDRLIHGQVVTKWIKSVQINMILIIDDKFAKDTFMQSLYKSVAPGGLKLKMMSVDDACVQWEKDQFKDSEMMVLFRNVDTVLRVVEKGIPIKSLNIGGMATKHGSKTVVGTISLTEEEAKILYDMQREKDMDIYFQILPDNSKGSLVNVLKKHFPNVIK